MPFTLSPSSLKLLKECPRCFWLHFNKKIHRPSTIFPSLPGGMDQVLKAHFDSFREQGKLPPELSSLEEDGIRLFDSVELLKVWQNNFKGIQWRDEHGNLLKGAVDSLLVKAEKIIVLDFKTRGFPLKEDTHKTYQDQLDIYNFLLQKNGYETADYAYLLFYHPTGVHHTGEVRFHTDLVRMDISIENAERIFTNAIAVLNGEIPPRGRDCGFCGWVEECRIVK